MNPSHHSWTFPVAGTDAAVATFADSEGLLLLNSTAAWIWHHRHESNLTSAYAEHFGLTPSEAESDVTQTLAAWARAEPFCTLIIQLLQTTFHLQFLTEAITDEILPRLAHLEIPAPPHTPHHHFRIEEHPHATHLYLNGSLLASEQFPAGARAVVLQELTRMAVPDREFIAILHAAACGTDGACAILAGSSFSGKSTLSTALMRSGLICLSDDSACLTPDFQVAGMPFAISLREGSWDLFPDLKGKRFIPSNLNGTSPTVPAKALVFISYEATAKSTTLQPIDPFSALLEIQKSGFWIMHTQPAITSFLNWLAQIPIYRLTYSDLDGAVVQIREVIS